MSRLRFLAGFADERVIEGGEDTRRQARQELRRRQRQAAAAGLPELEPGDLRFGRFGYVLHEPSNEQYRVYRGEVLDVQYGPAAFWVDEAGELGFLERVP